MEYAVTLYVNNKPIQTINVTDRDTGKRLRDTINDVTKATAVLHFKKGVV